MCFSRESEVCFAVRGRPPGFWRVGFDSLAAELSSRFHPPDFLSSSFLHKKSLKSGGFQPIPLLPLLCVFSTAGWWSRLLAKAGHVSHPMGQVLGADIIHNYSILGTARVSPFRSGFIAQCQERPGGTGAPSGLFHFFDALCFT